MLARLLPIVFTITFFTGHVFAQDDIEEAAAKSRERVLGRLDLVTQELEEATEMLAAIVAAENIVLGKSPHPTIDGFRDRFSHQTLFVDYLKFEREHSHFKNASGMLATVEPLENKLARFKKSLEKDILTPREVEEDLDELKIPDVITLAPRKQKAEELILRAESLTDEQLAKTMPLEDAIRKYREDHPNIPNPLTSNADIEQRIREAFPGQPMYRILEAHHSFGEVMTGSPEPTPNGYVVWVYCGYCSLKDKRDATGFGIPVMASKNFRQGEALGGRRGRNFSRNKYPSELTDFRNLASSPRLVNDYIKWFEIAQGYRFNTAGGAMTAEDALRMTTDLFDRMDRSAKSRKGTTVSLLTAAFERVIQERARSAQEQP